MKKISLVAILVCSSLPAYAGQWTINDQNEYARRQQEDPPMIQQYQNIINTPNPDYNQPQQVIQNTTCTNVGGFIQCVTN